MKDFIKEKLVEMHSNCTTDQYGQIQKFYFSLDSLFGEKTEEVLEFVKENPIIEVSTYGGASGIYKAVSNICDEEIKTACHEALRKNKSYIANMTGW
jgi:hypothetical protein